MAGDSSHNTTFDEVVRLLEQEESYIRIFGLPDNQTTGTSIENVVLSLFRYRSLIGAVSESASSTTTTPSLLDTAFLNVSTIFLLM